MGNKFSKLRGEGSTRRLAFEPLESRQLLSLTHWYTFNDGTGENLAGGADLALVNGATVLNGQAVLSNLGVSSGEANRVQYLDLPAESLPDSTSVTIAAWFTTTNAADWTRLFDFGNQSGGSGDSYLFYSPRTIVDDSRLVLTPGGIDDERIALTTPADDAQQHMVVAVIDAEADTLQLYVDGNQVSVAPLNGVDFTDVAKSLAYFGRSLYNVDPGFTGQIDEIRIYDEARSAAEITADAEAGAVPIPAPTSSTHPARQVEALDRGMVAVRQSSSEVYVGWRMLGTDPLDVRFNLYRSTDGTAPVKLNSGPLTQTTDFVDTTADLSADNAYFVRPIIAGVELGPSESFVLEANAPVRQFLNVPLQIPAGGTVPNHDDPEGEPIPYSYNANDASVGDLDGDGQYEIVLEWDPTNAKDSSHHGYTGNVLIDAYKLDGTLLWRIDLGRHIRAGQHYTQLMVYDLDGDGRAEVALKTAPHTRDGQDNLVLMDGDSIREDFRNSQGRILTGPEYLTVFDGETGAELSTIPFEPARGSASQWGDNYGNRVDRFLGGIAYLDGEHPSLIMARGYYGPQFSGGQARNEIVAYDFDGTELTQRWHFRAGYNINNDIYEEYVGQGAHSLTIGDVDGDGFDEVVYGAAVIDHDGTGLHSTTWGHGDALHLSDMIPDRPGLEVFMVHEDAGSYQGNGATVRDAATGELIFGIPASNDVGRGVAADIDPHHPGYEYWGHTASRDVYNSEGDPIYDQDGIFSNFVVWWDSDLSRELLDGTTIGDWNNGSRSNFDLDPGAGGNQIYAPNASSNNGTKSTPALSADILGDWREEVIWRRSDNSALQIFTTVIPATNRFPTLMHDTQYRVSIAAQNSAYNQPPHPSFFLGTGMSDPPLPNVHAAASAPPMPGDFDLDGDVDHDDRNVWQQNYGMSQTHGSLPGDADGNGQVDGSDFLTWQRNLGHTQAEVTSLADAPAAHATVELDEAFATLDSSLAALQPREVRLEAEVLAAENAAAEAPSRTSLGQRRYAPPSRTSMESVRPDEETKPEREEDTSTVWERLSLPRWEF